MTDIRVPQHHTAVVNGIRMHYVTAGHGPALTIPVRAFGGDACLGPLTLASAQAVAPGATGGIIDQCGHWAAEERPGFVADLIRELAGAH